jgi:hypothetical protein
MDFDLYKNKMEYPEKPKRPHIDSKASSDEARRYAKDLQDWEDRMAVYKVGLEGYRIEERRLMALFKKDALEDCGLTNHPKAVKAWDFAWSHGHASGLHNVHFWLSEVAELFTE